MPPVGRRPEGIEARVVGPEVSVDIVFVDHRGLVFVLFDHVLVGFVIDDHIVRLHAMHRPARNHHDRVAPGHDNDEQNRSRQSHPSPTHRYRLLSEF